ncbi:hypothetical protein [Gloeocapsopsis sp. IPPAS B-1203]|uniref:hypothetical protein n=1 Tax=Gloeocapsopsis sp. IPPAS B-1203 TaxID=2049454 RepID=UPI00117F9360|nr:hypothetical protein [Gloeocapsopsis sp. IPPAS B-1203]
MWNIVTSALTGAIATQTGEITSKLISEMLNEAEISNHTSKVTQEVIFILSNIQGMNQAHSRDLKRATPMFSLRDGTIVKFYQNLAFDHIFLSDVDGKLIYGGYISRIQANDLTQALNTIRVNFT